MIAEPQPKLTKDMMVFNFTKGGLHKFVNTSTLPSLEKKSAFYVEIGESFNKDLNNYREGWYGWNGYGGSCIHFHPEHKISLGYVPGDHWALEMANKRAGVLSKVIFDSVSKLKSSQGM